MIAIFGYFTIFENVNILTGASHRDMVCQNHNDIPAIKKSRDEPISTLTVPLVVAQFPPSISDSRY